MVVTTEKMFMSNLDMVKPYTTIVGAVQRAVIIVQAHKDKVIPIKISIDIQLYKCFG